MNLPQDLLDILVCPACKTPVTPTAREDGLACAQCHRVYPIRDGIPVLLIDQATIQQD